MEIDLERFRETFFQEAAEHVAQMEAGLLALAAGEVNLELLNAVFRGAHSIKGAAGTFGLAETTEFTHAMESLLDRMRSGDVDADGTRIDLLLKAVDVLAALLDAARRGGAAPADLVAVRNRLTVAQRAGPFDPAAPVKLRSRSDPQTKPAGPVWRIRFQPSPEVFLQGMDPVLVLRELSRLGTVLDNEIDLAGVSDLADLDPERCGLAWNLRLETAAGETEIRDVFAFVEEGARILLEREEPTSATAPRTGVARAPGGRDSGTIRVATEKVDRLIDLVGELVIAQSMAAQALQGFTMTRLPALADAFAEMERHTRELQERIMGVRMLPVAGVFHRMQRLVHDLAASTGKSIRLEISGEDTEIDKSMVEGIGDPLTHIIRNAADHGIEAPAERAAAGKPEQGLIRLSACHEGGSVVIAVSDDGRGLDAAKIRARAVERGLIRENEEIPEEQVRMLIFEAGFSTAERVTDISGRGVGLDVVRRNVEALNGAVSVESEAGRGSAIRLRLPLTLAILEGLLARVGSDTYILPLTAILESVRPRASAVRVVAGQGEVVMLRGEPVPLVRLHRLFHIPGAVTNPAEGITVIVEHQGRRLALLADQLLGQQQVVIKSLEANYRRVDGVAGATILGDGHPALIVDVPGIVNMASARSVAAA
jgi:two-component system chemotaxis sensor kinase CheA